MNKRELEEVINEMLEYVAYLSNEGVIQLNSKAVFNCESENGEGMVLIIMRTHRPLTLEEVENTFGVAEDQVDFAEKRPNLTLVKKDEN